LTYCRRPFTGHISHLRPGNNRSVQLGFITYTANDKTEDAYCKVNKYYKVGDKVEFKTIHRPSFDRVRLPRFRWLAAPAQSALAHGVVRARLRFRFSLALQPMAVEVVRLEPAPPSDAPGAAAATASATAPAPVAPAAAAAAPEADAPRRSRDREPAPPARGGLRYKSTEYSEVPTESHPCPHCSTVFYKLPLLNEHIKAKHPNFDEYKKLVEAERAKRQEAGLADETRAGAPVTADTIRLALQQAADSESPEAFQSWLEVGGASGAGRRSCKRA